MSIRWKDSGAIGVMGGTERMPITNDSDVDKHVTPFKLSEYTLNGTSRAEVAILAGVTVDANELNYLQNIDTNIQTALSEKATFDAIEYMPEMYHETWTSDGNAKKVSEGSIKTQTELGINLGVSWMMDIQVWQEDGSGAIEQIESKNITFTTQTTEGKRHLDEIDIVNTVNGRECYVVVTFHQVDIGGGT